jgi:purine nucleoside phosphorylase
MHPARIAIPEQIIDYSYAREHTYFAAETEAVDHIDFSYPYDENVIPTRSQPSRCIRVISAAVSSLGPWVQP